MTAPHFHTCEEVRGAIRDITLNEDSSGKGKPKPGGGGSGKVATAGKNEGVMETKKGADTI